MDSSWRGCRQSEAGASEALHIAFGDGLASQIPCVEMHALDPQNSTLEWIEPAVAAFFDVDVFDGGSGLAQAHLGAAFLGSRLLLHHARQHHGHVIRQYLQEHESTGVSRQVFSVGCVVIDQTIPFDRDAR